MKYSLIATSAFALALSATVCATTVLSSPEDNATEIANTFNRSMLNAMKIGTQNALATYYTKDAIVRGVTGDNAYGLQEIGKYWTEAGSNTSYNVRNEQASINGDTLTQMGVWSAEHKVDGMRGIGGGNLVRILTRQGDGSWKIAYEAWN